MGELRVSIPDELHRKLKQKALELNITLKKLVVALLKKGINFDGGEE